MPHSKFSEKPAFNKNHGFLKCTCIQFLEFKSKREEKSKIRLHSKNCSNPPEDSETIKPPGTRFSKTEMEHSWNQARRKQFGSGAAIGTKKTAGGLGGAVSPQRVQGRALVGAQGAKPPEAP